MGVLAVLQRADKHQMLFVLVGTQLVGGEEAAVGLVLGQFGLVDGTDVEQCFVGQVRVGLDEFGQLRRAAWFDVDDLLVQVRAGGDDGIREAFDDALSVGRVAGWQRGPGGTAGSADARQCFVCFLAW